MTARSSLAISGIGVVSAIGVGAAHFWTALAAGISGIRTLPGATAVPHIGAQLVDYLPREFISSAHLRRMDKVSRSLVASAKMALADARLDAAAVASEHGGIVVGTALGNIDESVQHLQRLFTKGPSLVSPMIFPNLVLNAPASYAAMETGSIGLNLTVTDGEIAAEQALALAADLLAAQRAEFVLTGGADEWSDIVVHAYAQMRGLAGQGDSEESCRPYDVRRNGTVLGEGAAMLLLEPTVHAQTRGVAPYAILEAVTNFSVPCAPYGWPAAPDSAVMQLRVWLEEVLSPRATIDLVITNANGSRRLDGFLLCVLERVFGETAARLALTSIRASIGEFGAAGALDLAAAALALRHQAVPPLPAGTEPPAACPFAFVRGQAESRDLERILHLAVGRGGGIAAALLRRAEVPRPAEQSG